LLGPPQAVRPDIVADDVAFGCEGKLLAANDHGVLRILEWPSGHEVRTLRLEDGIFGFALSPGGRFCAAWPWAAAWAATGPRRVWELATGKVCKELPPTNIYGGAFTPDERCFIAGNENEYLMWDTRTWSNVWRLARENSGGAHARVAFTRDGLVGALTLSAQTIRLFEPSTGREFATLTAPEPQTLSWLAFSPDGTRLAATTQSSAVHLWDLGLIRKDLAAMKLDWDTPQPPGQTDPPRRVVEIFISRTNSLSHPSSRL
jgi:WD40 repeat protein